MRVEDEAGMRRDDAGMRITDIPFSLTWFYTLGVDDIYLSAVERELEQRKAYVCCCPARSSMFSFDTLILAGISSSVDIAIPSFFREYSL